MHRDIKLENILLNEENDIEKGLKLIDFGIAGKVQISLEQHNTGTVRYMSPELLSKQVSKADTRLDVWSLGILFYRLVYGKFPFDGKDWAEIKKNVIDYKLKFPTNRDVMNEQEEVPLEIKTFIKLMLEKDPEKRIQLY